MKGSTILLIVSVMFVGLIIFSSQRNNTSPEVSNNDDNVIMENGVQVVEITARGGYRPRKSVAKEGVPTTIRFNTSNTFDCSASVRIPSLNISESLPYSGIKDIPIGVQSAGVLYGTCGMGMYPFEIKFVN